MATTNRAASPDKADNEASDAATGSAKPSGTTEQRSPRTVTVELPFVTATFRRPEINLPAVRVPNRQEVRFAAHTVQSYLPAPRQAVYYGGLAALAAFEVIEWPVALAIGAGSALMGRSERRQPRPRAESGTTATKETTTSAKAGKSSSGRSAGIPPSS